MAKTLTRKNSIVHVFICYQKYIYFLAHFHSLDATYIIEPKQCLGSCKRLENLSTKVFSKLLCVYFDP